ncbi:hypothetical protein CRUP_016422 [Coryphaenoides rupestris]|nr:hypothetical protein CRUP_016422 [Coryphaenoides rupestris]
MRKASDRAPALRRGRVDSGVRESGGAVADYFSCVATVVYIRKENCMYQACPTPDCSKKVVKQHSGLYRCDKCSREFPDFKPRLLLSADYFSCVATVVYIRKENCMYQACPTPDCSKKVVKQHSGLYRCDKCSREFPDFKPRLLLSDTAEVLLGHSGAHSGPAQKHDVFLLCLSQDESRVKATVVEVQPIDHRDYSRRLIRNIRKMAA